MDKPHSLRLKEQGEELDRRHNRTGLKQPDIVRLALHNLFAKFSDKELMAEVIKFRAREARLSK